MSYEFKFDLSKIAQSLFDELYLLAGEKQIQKVEKLTRRVIEKLPIKEIMELPFPLVRRVVKDFATVHLNNISYRERFEKTSKRALFLPHCSRKYMDNRCEARFNSEFSFYKCQECSEDCLINQAQKMGKKEGYDVYIVPGGSCIPKLLKKKDYNGVVGVACCAEIKLADEYLKKMDIPYQAVPLVRNGCSGTEFIIEELNKRL